MVYGIKVMNVKKGKRYGPYPKEDGLWYLYEYSKEGGRMKKKFVGKGPLPERAKGVIQETVSNIPRQGKLSSKAAAKKSPFELIAEYSELMARVSRRYRKGYYNSLERKLVGRSLLFRYTTSMRRAFEEPESSWIRPSQALFISLLNSTYSDVLKVTRDLDIK